MLSIKISFKIGPIRFNHLFSFIGVLFIYGGPDELLTNLY